MVTPGNKKNPAQMEFLQNSAILWLYIRLWVWKGGAEACQVEAHSLHGFVTLTQ